LQHFQHLVVVRTRAVLHKLDAGVPVVSRAGRKSLNAAGSTPSSHEITATTYNATVGVRLSTHGQRFVVTIRNRKCNAHLFRDAVHRNVVNSWAPECVHAAHAAAHAGWMPLAAFSPTPCRSHFPGMRRYSK
jgi:hypothetical protein